MTKMGVFLSTQELRVVFETFDINGDGQISYQEMVETLRVSNGSLKFKQTPVLLTERDLCRPYRLCPTGLEPCRLRQGLNQL